MSMSAATAVEPIVAMLAVDNLGSCWSGRCRPNTRSRTVGPWVLRLSRCNDSRRHVSADGSVFDAAFSTRSRHCHAVNSGPVWAAAVKAPDVGTAHTERCRLWRAHRPGQVPQCDKGTSSLSPDAATPSWQHWCQVFVVFLVW